MEPILLKLYFEQNIEILGLIFSIEKTSVEKCIFLRKNYLDHLLKGKMKKTRKKCTCRLCGGSTV